MYDINDLKAKRIGAGYTAAQLADFMHVTRQQIYLIESKKRTRLAACKYYSYAVNDIWDSVSDDEKAWRYECGKLNVNPAKKNNEQVVEFIKQTIKES